MYSHTQLGISVTDTAVTLALAKRRGREWSVEHRARVDLPPGAVQDGTIRDVAAVAKGLKECFGKVQTSGATPAILCIPSRHVYGALLHLPSGTRRDDESVRSATQGLFPEPIDQMRLVSRALPPDAAGAATGVAAVRTDVLQPFIDTCATAGITLRAVTTVPCAIATSRGIKAPLIVFLAGAENVQPSVTLLLQGWPIDEDILPAGTSPEDAAKAVTGLSEEYVAKGKPVGDVLVAAPSAVRTALTKGHADAKTRAHSHASSATTYRVTSLVTKEQDLEWLGATAAATAPVAKLLSLYGAPPPKKRKWYLVVMAVLLLVLLGLLLR